MERIVSGGYSDVIGSAFNLLPVAVRDKLRHVIFFTGTDPVYAGLHNDIDISDGRSFRNTAHVCYPWHTSYKRTIVVLPTLINGFYTVIHELGHCLDEALGFEYTVTPINEYARTNRYEAFAESFAAQYFWLGEKQEDLFQSDKATQYLFEQLVLGNT